MIAGNAAELADACGRQGGSVDRHGAGWIAQLRGRWWVLHTRAQNEKRVAEELDRHQCQYYLPLVRVQHTYSRGRHAAFHKPLFPGYVFLCGDYRDREIAWRTHRVAAVLDALDQDRLRRELEHIYRVVESGRNVELYQGLQAGRPCRITSGPLRGVEGVVLQWCGRTRLYVGVSLIGQSATVEIDAALLEAVA
ncbi:MAG: transcription termination/antitermination NusG family protein [Planctomycetota bacterium]